jgi:hypothetical protein
MYDGVDLTKVPTTGATMIAFYLNGTYAVPSIDFVTLRFPGWSQVPIDVKGDRPDYARVLDVERGDATPQHVNGWITLWQARNPAFHGGGRPVIYTDRSNIKAVFKGAGRYVLGRDYYLWVSTLDGTLYTGLGVVASQRRDYGDYDESVVYSPQWIPGHVSLSLHHTRVSPDLRWNQDKPQQSIRKAGNNARNSRGLQPQHGGNMVYAIHRQQVVRN